MRRIAWMSEDDEWDHERDDTYFLGTFSGHVDDGRSVAEDFEGYSLEDALAWARERSERTGHDEGWTAYLPVYELEVEAEASTREAAVASAIARCKPLPDGWHAAGAAIPA